MNACPLCHQDLSEAIGILGDRNQVILMHLAAHLKELVNDLKLCALDVIENHPRLEDVKHYKSMTNLENALFRIDRLEREGEAWLDALNGSKN